ncbi:MAG: hypothetical protein DME76_18290 [Verrucomicrobia bacterium]|nr:MAG: hypothetical protein DME76_18290 [Verrucomicrobiota bacterium]
MVIGLKCEKTEDRFDSLQQHLFELRPLYSLLNSAIVVSAGELFAKIGVDGFALWGKDIDHRVHGSSCALHSAMRDVLSGVRSALRHILRRVDRPRLNAHSGNGEGENH